MTSQDFILFSLQVAAMLGIALLFGEVMRRFGQPAVLGEMIGGILLGPTVFGSLAPALFARLFLSSPSVAMVRDASIKMGMLFFLFIAGLEVNLSDLQRLGKRAILIGSVGTLLPILAGLGLAYLLPPAFWGQQIQPHFFAFALFLGMNLANSANPVIARILMDLGLLKEEIGAVIMTATIIDDLVNWSLFAIILSDIAPSGPLSVNLPLQLVLLLVFFVFILGIGRWLGPKALHWARQRLSWPSGFIALTALVILAAGSISEGLGLHAFLGAFLAGVALGGYVEEKNQTEMNPQAHEVIYHFVLSFFAPIYFVSMGLQANFLIHFDIAQVLVVLLMAFLSKMGGVILGARLAGMPFSRKVLAISFGLNARGATGIILAGVGLEHGLIDERIFVTLVVMAIVTSLVSGPAIKRLISLPDGESDCS